MPSRAWVPGVGSRPWVDSSRSGQPCFPENLPAMPEWGSEPGARAPIPGVVQNMNRSPSWISRPLNVEVYLPNIGFFTYGAVGFVTVGPERNSPCCTEFTS